ncbi:MAG: DUF928 domain-containing protein [Chamaesiphon sp. CSU_1_12]|nr:DUF928 domain-containing protein [Chamaesiphon sp. CSU_1_12]
MKTPIQKITHCCCLVAIALLSTIVTSATLPNITHAQSAIKPKPSPKIRWKPPIPPSSLGIPGNRAQGGGTRGCKPYQGITALVPLSPQNIPWGRTIANRPTVWLHVPQELPKDLPIEIAVREQNGKPIAKQLFLTKSSISSGAIGISFPISTALQVNRIYRWEVSLYCDSQERVDRPLVVQGQIQRIAAPVKLAAAKTDLEITQIFAETGIWYDAITQIGNRLAKTKEPELVTAWSELIKSAGIKGLVRIQNWSAIEAIENLSFFRARI